MFAFSQIEPSAAGTVERMNVPLDRYFKAALEQGWHDSTFDSIRRMDEYYLERGPDAGVILKPEEAQNRFPAPNLEYKGPVRENQARLLQQRQVAENYRAFLLSQGGQGIARQGSGFVAMMLANMANPLDFALTMMPYVGEEKMAAQATKIGLSSWRARMAKGIMSTEDIGASGFKYSGFAASTLNGAVGMAMTEPARAAARLTEGKDYNVNEFLKSVAEGAAFGGAMHLGIEGAKKVWSKLHPKVQEEMVRKALSDVLQDREIDVAPMVKVDSEAIMEKMWQEHEAAIEDAKKGISLEDVKKDVFEKYRDEVTGLAIRNRETGEVLTGPSAFMHNDLLQKHGLIDEAGNLTPEAALYEPGFVTTKKRFIGRDEAALLHGINEPMHAGFEYDITREESTRVEEMVKDGLTRDEAINVVNKERKDRAREYFTRDPANQQLVQQEYQRQVQDAVDKVQKQFDPIKRFDALKQQEQDKMVQAGKTMPDEQVTKHTFDNPEKDITEISQEVQDLEKELKSLQDAGDIQGVLDKVGEELKKDKAIKDKNVAQLDAIDTALQCILKKVS